MAGLTNDPKHFEEILMKNLKATIIATAVSLIFSANALAETMSKDAYKAAEDQIEATYKSEKALCEPLSGNAKDVCVAQAKGKEKTAKAELEARYEPTEKNHYKARVAKAEADYDVAKEKCDDLSGNEKDVCIKEAKAAETKAKADAEVARQSAKGPEKAAEAKKEAAEDKREADYKVAKEKCDALSGDAKSLCVNEAKARYAQ